MGAVVEANKKMEVVQAKRVGVNYIELGGGVEHQLVLIVASEIKEKRPQCLLEIADSENVIVLTDTRVLFKVLNGIQFSVILLALEDPDVCTAVVEEIMAAPALGTHYKGRILTLPNAKAWWMRDTVLDCGIVLHPDGARLDESVAALIEKNRSR